MPPPAAVTTPTALGRRLVVTAGRHVATGSRSVAGLVGARCCWAPSGAICLPFFDFAAWRRLFAPVVLLFVHYAPIVAPGALPAGNP